MKRIFLSILALVACVSVGVADTVQTPIIYTGTNVSLTGTAGSRVVVATLTGTAQSFLVTNARVIVLSASGVTANPVVQLVSGTVALTGTAAVTGSANYVTTLTAVTLTPLILTGSAGLPLSLSIVTGGTATALSARVSVQGHYLK